MKSTHLYGPGRAILRREPPTYFGSGFRALVRRTVLLNLGIALPVLLTGLCLDGPESFLMVLVLLPSVSLILWSATFSIAGFVALCRVFSREGVAAARPLPAQGARVGGVVDDWLDGPV